MAKPEPLAESLRRIYRRTPLGTYKLHATERAKIQQRLKAFERIEQPTELQRRELYRLRAAQRGQVKPLARDIGGASRGMVPGLGPGPMNIFAGMGLAGLGAKIAAPQAAKGLFYIARRGAFYKAAQAIGGAITSTIQPAQGPVLAPTGHQIVLERARKIREAARMAVSRTGVPPGVSGSPKPEPLARQIERLRKRGR